MWHNYTLQIYYGFSSPPLTSYTQSSYTQKMCWRTNVFSHLTAVDRDVLWFVILFRTFTLHPNFYIFQELKKKKQKVDTFLLNMVLIERKKFKACAHFGNTSGWMCLKIERVFMCVGEFSCCCVWIEKNKTFEWNKTTERTNQRGENWTYLVLIQILTFENENKSMRECVMCCVRIKFLANIILIKFNQIENGTENEIKKKTN